MAFREDDKVVSFKYYTGGFQDLNEQLSRYFKDIKFDIQSIRKIDMDNVLSKQLKVVKRRRLNHVQGSSAVHEAFNRLVTVDTRLERDIVAPVMDSILEYAKTPSTIAEYSFMFLLTLYNCCRQSDLKNLDPATLEIIENNFLGRIVRGLVTDTKTRKARFIYFYPVAGIYDPIVALHRLLLETEPKDKSLTSNFEVSRNTSCCATTW